MAIIIGTNSDGYVTYINEPDTEKTLFKNVDSVISDLIDDIEKIENDITAIENDITAIDVTDKLRVTPSTNCDTVEIVKATVSAGYLSLQFTVKPSLELAPTTNLFFTLEGIEPAIIPDWRFALGSAGINFFQGWLSAFQNNITTVLIKQLSSSNNWLATTTVIMNGIIPIKGFIELSEVGE